LPKDEADASSTHSEPTLQLKVADSTSLTGSSTVLDASETKKRAVLPLRTSANGPGSSGLTLTSYVLPSPPDASVHCELRQFTPSDFASCKAAAQFKRGVHSTTPGLRFGSVEAPPGTVTPLLSAILAPSNRNTPRGARIAATMEVLAASPGGEHISHAAPIARCSAHNLLGTALHAAILGACIDPYDYLQITSSLIAAGAPVDCTLVSTPALSNSCALSLPLVSAVLPAISEAPSRKFNRSNTVGAHSAATKVLGDGEVDPSHWLHGATPMHLVALFGLHHGRSIIPLIETLKGAGASMYALPHSVVCVFGGSCCGDKRPMVTNSMNVPRRDNQ
jgi:hypothetical protein